MIFVDMDGVVANFVGGAMLLHNRDETIDPATWPAGVWYVEDVLGISTDEFWQAIDDGGDSFWRSLPLYPWSIDMIDSIRSLNVPWAFLSAPSRSHHSAAGKVQFLQEHFGESFRDYILTPAEHKQHLAGPGRILIDDNDTNCEAWGSRGGTAILFPQPWNKRCDQIPTDYLGWIQCELTSALEAVGAGVAS